MLPGTVVGTLESRFFFYDFKSVFLGIPIYTVTVFNILTLDHQLLALLINDGSLSRGKMCIGQQLTTRLFFFSLFICKMCHGVELIKIDVRYFRCKYYSTLAFGFGRWKWNVQWMVSRAMTEWLRQFWFG